MDAQTIIAKRIARELRTGMLVNLGIGIPTMVANFVPSDVNVFFHTAKGKSKIVTKCDLPLTSVRPIDLLVSEMAVIAFPEGKATLLETGPGVTVDQVVAATAAKLVLANKIPEMQL